MVKASIIIPVYNKEKYIKDTLTWVDKQTKDDIEVIIIDDASTDNSMDIVTDFTKNTKKQVEILKNNINHGVSYCRNLGIEQANSDYITFLDADDILDKTFIENMLIKANRYPDIDIIRGKLILFMKNIGILTNGRLKGYYEDQIIKPDITPTYITEEVISCNARLYKSDFIKNFKFQESCFEDYEFFLDTTLNANKILYTETASYGYRIIEDGKYKNSFSDINKSCLTFIEIFDRVKKKYPNINPNVYKNLCKKQQDVCIKYLNNVINMDNITRQDKYDFIKNYLTYLNISYGLDVEVIKDLFDMEINPLEDLEKIKVNIKQISSKY